jgi:pantoate--beta-alanine ligase
MVIFKNADEIASLLTSEKIGTKSIGFVPTMGALHHGHISLVQASKEQNETTVCSIFVNPAQFNNKEDFDRYPVTTEKDIELLISSGCDILFLPPQEQVYPTGYEKKVFDLGKIETMLEGQYRPGHFQGVCNVMDRLLEIVHPQQLYMGQKDYQQCMVVQKLLELSGRRTVELVVEPTMREADGLAMSSRNMRLSVEDREKAPTIYKALTYIQNNLSQLPLKIIKRTAREMLETQGFTIDYIEIVDAYTLENTIGHSQKIVALIAASINNIRLFDNMILN